MLRVSITWDLPLTERVAANAFRLLYYVMLEARSIELDIVDTEGVVLMVEPIDVAGFVEGLKRLAAASAPYVRVLVEDEATRKLLIEEVEVL
jgi:hypothetical protein